MHDVTDYYLLQSELLYGEDYTFKSKPRLKSVTLRAFHMNM